MALLDRYTPSTPPPSARLLLLLVVPAPPPAWSERDQQLLLVSHDPTVRHEYAMMIRRVRLSVPPGWARAVERGNERGGLQLHEWRRACATVASAGV